MHKKIISGMPAAVLGLDAFGKKIVNSIKSRNVLLNPRKKPRCKFFFICSKDIPKAKVPAEAIFCTREKPKKAVPNHVISGNPAMIARFLTLFSKAYGQPQLCSLDNIEAERVFAMTANSRVTKRLKDIPLAAGAILLVSAPQTAALDRIITTAEQVQQNLQEGAPFSYACLIDSKTRRTQTVCLFSYWKNFE